MRRSYKEQSAADKEQFLNDQRRAYQEQNVEDKEQFLKDKAKRMRRTYQE